MKKIVMALDQGTSSSRTILFDENGHIVASANKAFPSFYPNTGWVEQDPNEIWNTQKQTINEVLEKANLKFSDVTAIGITNQRETTIAWNKKTGSPLGKAIVWQCRRTAEYCKQLKSEGFEDTVKQKTGLIIDPYFSGTKMRWILENIREAKELAKTGQLFFGTVDSWLIWKLTGGKVHATDASNASRTMLMDLKTLQWSPEILNELNIPESMLPRIVPSIEVRDIYPTCNIFACDTVPLNEPVS